MLLTSSVLGVKGSMLPHLISCPHAWAAGKTWAKKEKAGKSKQKDDNDSGSGTDAEAPARKRKRFQRVEKEMKQTQLKVFKGLDIPFSDAQGEAVRTQFLRATVSANLPFRWTLDPEVIKLFMMFRSTATDVMPTDKVISGRLLDEEVRKVDKEVAKTLKGKYVTLSCVNDFLTSHSAEILILISSDGWKDKYSVTGVDASYSGKVQSLSSPMPRVLTIVVIFNRCDSYTRQEERR